MDLPRLHVLLVCNLGASTGIMVAKMREIAKNSQSLANTDVKIDARPAGELREYVADYDVVLIGPQIKHLYENLKKICDEHNKPIGIIDTQDYGMVNGGNILKQAIRLVLTHRP
ncbi:PTS sugar transporter subunit IIB [Caldibacillus debilis]|mgnify:FL=1|uniref:Phosphotransferase system cellobiose-specific component IIB n=1 Tax=Caldibacillus debilis GB1 TaxID=1339248 RepID=A0A420VCU8_9BACI|nr:PTS sugar transporter subunit IIB [Caldibacillus debilis]RKO61477.1 Phosphotransferase system cellobiose-specific component IIB [Caldibacillus debilis GB1]